MSSYQLSLRLWDGILDQKKHKWTIDEFLDSARDHVGKILDNLNARDLVYVVAYCSAVVLCYQTITGITKSFENDIYGTIVSAVLKLPPSSDVGEVAKKIDQHALLLSLVAAYGLLKLDLGDVSSAISKVSTALGAVAAV